MGRTVAELELSLGSAELSEWIAFYELEPFGPRRDNYHAGMIAAMIANSNRAKGAKAVSPSDFMLEDPATGAKKRTQTAISHLLHVATPAEDS